MAAPGAAAGSCVRGQPGGGRPRHRRRFRAQRTGRLQPGAGGRVHGDRLVPAAHPAAQPGSHGRMVTLRPVSQRRVPHLCADARHLRAVQHPWRVRVRRARHDRRRAVHSRRPVLPVGGARPVSRIDHGLEPFRRRGIAQRNGGHSRIGAASGDTIARLQSTISDADLAVQLLIADPATRANPYDAYRALRAEKVYRTPVEIWFAASYSACNQVVRSFTFRRRHQDSWERRAALNGSTGRRWLEDQSRWMLWLDPPDHARIRGLVGQSFSPRYIEKQRDSVVAVVDRLIDSMAGSGEVDFVQAFALPLPMTVICDMLGIPVADRRNFRVWSSAAGGTLEPMPAEPVQDAADQATDAFNGYFGDLVEQRRRSPGDDLLTKLIAAESEDGTLSHEELISNAVLLLAAGFETTTNLLGNGLLALLRNPEQWRRLG